MKKREKLAAEVHDIWINWMNYMIGDCADDITFSDDHFNVRFKAEDFTRWCRQMQEFYVDLSEEEKDSDREIADRIIKVLEE